MDNFLTYVLVIVCEYVAQTIFKISNTIQDGTFDWKVLFKGVLQHAIYVCGVFVLFYGGTFVPDDKIIQINGEGYSIINALTLLAYTLMGVQGVKCVKNIIEHFTIDEKQEPIEINDYQARG